MTDEPEPIGIAELARYWNDPAFAAQRDRELANWRLEANAAIDAGMRRYWDKRDAERAAREGEV